MGQVIAGVVGVVVLIFVAVLLGTVMGGVAGWIVGLFFDAPQQVATLLGLELTNFQVGALLGFVGGFLKSSSSSSSS